MILACAAKVTIRVQCWTLCIVFCAAVGAVAQQPAPQVPGTQLPDVNTPNPKPTHHEMTKSKDVSEKLHKEFDPKNAAYAGSNIQAAVDDHTVILTGTVKSGMQHEMALQLAKAQADDRKIIDRMIVQQ
jgi:hypothetical protein